MTLEFSASLALGPFTYEAAFDAGQEIVVLFGESGAGKSLSLQMAAGLLRPAAGRIAIGGQVVFDASRGVDIAPQRRGVGYVVQDLALFPHMTVAENVAFGMQGARSQRRARTAELLAMLGLAGFEGRKPRSLSGGQQQRVALARALGRDVEVLLLDEPFSALDEALRASLRAELLRLREQLGLTIVFVTHDLREAHLLADRLAVFDAGRVLQFDARETVFRAPASRRVAELTGVANILAGRVLSAARERLLVQAGPLQLDCNADGRTFAAGQDVDVCIRAERVNLRRSGAIEPRPNTFDAAIVAELAYGATHTLRLLPDAGGALIESEIAARPYEVLGVAAEKRWRIELPPEDLRVMQRAVT